jgi:hypothetical protein
MYGIVLGVKVLLVTLIIILCRDLLSTRPRRTQPTPFPFWRRALTILERVQVPGSSSRSSFFYIKEKETRGLTCSGQSSTRRGFFPGTSLSPCNYHCTSALYSFFIYRHHSRDRPYKLLFTVLVRKQVEVCSV